MNLIYKKWDGFCKKLCENGIKSITAADVSSETKQYVVLKHDVETAPQRALIIAGIEKKYGHRGSYYVQAYLLENPENIKILSEIRNMGHEVSYHYDVMDSCGGNIDKAIECFSCNKKLFENNGFGIETVCQHGNPVVIRDGYTSNRDFFRSDRVRAMFPEISDIMVNFGEQKGTGYRYFSDAGGSFKLIFDPINNDIVNSDDKNTVYKDLNVLFSDGIDRNGGNIVSIHPHRFRKSAIMYGVRSTSFKMIRAVAKVFCKFPFFKRIIGRYYYLAKKI